MKNYISPPPPRSKQAGNGWELVKTRFNGLGCESDQVIPNFYNRWGVEKAIKINKNINEHLFVFPRFVADFFTFVRPLIETNYLSIGVGNKRQRRDSVITWLFNSFFLVISTINSPFIVSHVRDHHFNKQSGVATLKIINTHNQAFIMKIGLGLGLLSLGLMG